ncbi:hypothetical protein AAVH_34371, partial [Aphelenchoides avenae]
PNSQADARGDRVSPTARQLRLAHEGGGYVSEESRVLRQLLGLFGHWKRRRPVVPQEGHARTAIRARARRLRRRRPGMQRRPTGECVQ